MASARPLPGIGPPERTVQAVEALSHDAVEWVTEEIYRRHARLLSTRGAKGRHHTRQDLHYHIEFLNGALATEEPVFFTDYVLWLATVLESRGVPAATLDDSLRLLQEFYEQRLGAGFAAPAAYVLEQGRRALAEAPRRRQPPYGAHLPPAFAAAHALARSLVDGDVATARSLAQRGWKDTGDYVEVATRLFQPSLYEIGQLWERNEITVAQEHLATAISQTLLTQLFLTAVLFAEPVDRSALFADVEGNQHALGLRLVADSFELAGWSVQYLGANTPNEALIAQIDAVRPEVVGLSASLVQHLPTMRRCIESLRRELGAWCPTVLVGGLATNQLDRVWRWVGADAWSPDARTAVSEVA